MSIGLLRRPCLPVLLSSLAIFVACSRATKAPDSVPQRSPPQSGVSPLRAAATAVVITSLDLGPSELEAKLPWRARVLRTVPAPDHGDYILVELAQPITSAKEGTTRHVTHAVLSPHLVGTSLVRGASNLGTKIAYVIDARQVAAPALDFAMVEYVAIGFITVE